MNPYGRDSICRPGFPEIVKEALEEEKEKEDEGIWREVIRRDEDLQEKVKKKEKEFMEEQEKKSQSLSDSLFGDPEDSLEKTIDDLI